MQNLGPHPRPAEPESAPLPTSPGVSFVHSSLRRAVLAHRINAPSSNAKKSKKEQCLCVEAPLLCAHGKYEPYASVDTAQSFLKEALISRDSFRS